MSPPHSFHHDGLCTRRHPRRLVRPHQPACCRALWQQTRWNVAEQPPRPPLPPYNSHPGHADRRHHSNHRTRPSPIAAARTQRVIRHPSTVSREAVWPHDSRSGGQSAAWAPARCHVPRDVRPEGNESLMPALHRFVPVNSQSLLSILYAPPRLVAMPHFEPPPYDRNAAAGIVANERAQGVGCTFQQHHRRSLHA